MNEYAEYADDSVWDQCIPIEAKAGDLYIQDGRLWHGTLPNTTDSTRWALVTTFTRWFIVQHYNLTKTVPDEIIKQLSPKQEHILGFNTQALLGIHEGVDIKKGYENLS